MNVLRRPQLRVSSRKDDAADTTEVEGCEGGSVDRVGQVAEVDNEGGPAERIDVEGLDAWGAVDEVSGGIDVGSGVNPAAELADVGRVAVRQELRLCEGDAWVARPDVHPGLTSTLTSRVVTEPWFGSTACSRAMSAPLVRRG